MQTLLQDMTSRVLVASGAQGTVLAKHGFSLGESYAAWVLEHPDAVKELFTQYVACDIDILSIGCGSSNRFRLQHYGLGDRAYQISRDMVGLTKEICPEDPP